MTLFAPIQRNLELEGLFEKARLATEAMPPEERASMYACQVIGYVASEIFMSVHEEGVPPDAARRSLQRILDALDGDAGVYANIPMIVEKVWCLLPADKIHMRTRVSNILSELDT